MLASECTARQVAAERVVVTPSFLDLPQGGHHRSAAVYELTVDWWMRMTKPIPDKAEIALEYPDKLYVGTFRALRRDLKRISIRLVSR